MPLAQGFFTQEALLMVGEELRAIAEAEQTIEVAQIVQERGDSGYAGNAAGSRCDQDGHCRGRGAHVGAGRADRRSGSRRSASRPWQPPTCWKPGTWRLLPRLRHKKPPKTKVSLQVPRRKVSVRRTIL